MALRRCRTRLEPVRAASRFFGSLRQPAELSCLAWNIMEQRITLPTSDEIRALVRPDHVHRRAYADAAVFQLEQGAFSWLWIYVAHDQLRKPGDFVRTRLAAFGFSSPVTPTATSTCCRRCRTAARYGRSRQRQGVQLPLSCLVIPADGSLDSVPHRRAIDAFSLDDPQNHMQRVYARLPRLRVRHAEREPAPLIQHLGSMAEVIDNLVDRAGRRIEIADSSFTLEYCGNWKLPENAATFPSSFVQFRRRRPAALRPMPRPSTRPDREMLLANGFGPAEWEGIQLNGLSGGHVLRQHLQQGRADEPGYRSVAVRHRAALAERSARTPARARREPVQQHHLSQSRHQRSTSRCASPSGFGRSDHRASIVSA
jgi:hypothetical protein